MGSYDCAFGTSPVYIPGASLLGYNRFRNYSMLAYIMATRRREVEAIRGRGEVVYYCLNSEASYDSSPKSNAIL
jgi:hypothetical protein